MKKYIVLSMTSLLMAGCVDVGVLGYPNEHHYATRDKAEVTVHYAQNPPATCKEIAIAHTAVNNGLQETIEQLRGSAAEKGANYVKIDDVSIRVNAWGVGSKMMMAVMYRCQ